jgi:hypothetical protein
MRRRLSRSHRGGALDRPAPSVPPTEGSRPVPVIIIRAQRDAIYEMVINHLTAIGDVWWS